MGYFLSPSHTSPTHPRGLSATQQCFFLKKCVGFLDFGLLPSANHPPGLCAADIQRDRGRCWALHLRSQLQPCSKIFPPAQGDTECFLW